MKAIELKNGRKVIIREAVEEDAKALMQLNLSVMKEGQFLVTRAEEYNETVEETRNEIRKHLREEGYALYIADVNGKPVGMISFKNGSSKGLQHKGNFSLLIEKDYREMGIGKALMERLLEWAENHPKIEKVSLAVFADNHRAIALYRKFGFQEEGRLIKETKRQDGQYVDDLLMYKFV